MIKKHVQRLIVITTCCVLIALQGLAQDAVEEKHILVSMRMIGHELLLNVGDSVSRVMPIEEEDGRYKISFEKELEFMPELLVFTVGEVLKENEIAESYIVEVETCDSNNVVYSYEIGAGWPVLPVNPPALVYTVVQRRTQSFASAQLPQIAIAMVITNGDQSAPELRLCA